MKKLALDLDGVIFDSEDLFRVYTEMYDVDVKRSDNVIDNSIRLFQQRYNWSKEEIDEFYEKYALEVTKKSNFVPGVDLVIPKLKEYFDIIIVTARNDEQIECIRDKFKELGIQDAKVFSGHNKVEILIKEKVDYVIDDSETVCKDASSNKIHALFFKNNAANKLEENEYLKNVNNWGEVYKYIMLKEVLNKGE